MADDGPWCQTAFSLQIVAELREYLVLRAHRRQRRRRDVPTSRSTDSHRFSAARSPD